MTRAKATINVAREPLEKALADAQSVLNATREHAVQSERFDWLYRRNPDGDAVLWSVRDGSGEMAGFTVCLPRRVSVWGRPCICWNGADFSILPKYRSLGVAVKLRRAAKDAVDAGEVDFLYAHPNERMAVIHSRAGHTAIGTMARYARPLRAEPYLARRISNEKFVRALASPGNAVLQLWDDRKCRMKSTHELSLHTERFDERFDELSERVCRASTRQVIGVRDSQYLNWRYADNPLYNTHVILAEREGEGLRGFLLFVEEQGLAQIKDIFCIDHEAQHDLVIEMIREARCRQLYSLFFTILDTNPILNLLTRCGFRRRETSQMFGYASEGSPYREMVLDDKTWYVTSGDRDV